MIKWRSELVNKEFIDNVICNVCGETIDHNSSNWIAIDITFSYGSQNDGDNEKSDICECCYNNIKKIFIVPPTVTSIL